ncbi:S1/P1 nuclease [Psychrobium sp. MM17-31]|uniref:S1/P1 nuclease n=1 Tax=Psychrobium sp. MM17-31 TaxID=2917758 RepID=UPI001EF49CAB|nr:S1/P1 nuclease [Psychrobium sp. MM17-31]MCG7530557.1 S1/P1 nuclease [Psychrobium sp. MM17-31]
MNAINKLLIFIFLSFISLSSFALGQLGHQVVCDLAYNELPQNQQQQISQLLTAMPKAHRIKLNRYMNQDDDAAITFAKSCVWADAIKKQADYKQFEKWHFMNVPRTAQNITTNACKKDCIGQAVNIHQQQVSTAQDPWQKLQALMFLGHWLGDIHQPLHVSYANDWGGNKIKITKRSNVRCETLHWYWDDCVLSRQARSFEQWISHLSSNKSVTTTQWRPEHVWQWADESYQIVTSADFKYCVKQDGSCRSPRDNKVTLPADYQAQFAPVINQRMILAGQRLAQLLKQSM